MLDFEGIFKDKKPDAAKLSACGFSLEGKTYKKEFPLEEGQFLLKVFITADGQTDYRVYDAETDGEYYLARVQDAEGAFVGRIHAACKEIFSKIARECFDSERFCGQTKRILLAVKQRYGADLEFLWEKYPEFAVLRVPGKKPWFALVGRVEKRKLGICEEGSAEIINLKNLPEVVTERIRNRLAFAAYHMNKRLWFSTLLDGSLPDEEILSLVGESFRLAKG